MTVVGIVGSVRFSGVDDDGGLEVYAPHTQMFAGDSDLVLRSATTGGLDAQIRAALDRVDPEQSFFDLMTMEERVAASLWQQRVTTAVLSLFAGVALVLAIVGAYAVTAHAVAGQRREIGIRLTLGSSSSALGWRVARTWLIRVFGGVIAGIVGAVLLGPRLAEALDLAMPAVGWPLALPAVLAAAAAMGIAVPVVQAMQRVAPVQALRTE